CRKRAASATADHFVDRWSRNVFAAIAARVARCGQYGSSRSAPARRESRHGAPARQPTLECTPQNSRSSIARCSDRAAFWRSDERGQRRAGQAASPDKQLKYDGRKTLGLQRINPHLGKFLSVETLCLNRQITQLAARNPLREWLLAGSSVTR